MLHKTSVNVKYFVESLLFIILTGCNIEPIIPNPSYNAHIRPIFQRRCQGCHGTRWNDYKQVIDNISLIEYKVIKAKVMPPSGLPVNEYNAIRDWINQGVKE